MTDYLTITLPGLFAPIATVKLIGLAADVARCYGRQRLAGRLAWWAYDVADVGLGADAAFDAHRQAMPWAWN
jgi:hypothetical protein